MVVHLLQPGQLLPQRKALRLVLERLVQRSTNRSSANLRTSAIEPISNTCVIRRRPSASF
eukprot:2858571-Pyramimonas_sp.AAC.1